MSDQFTLKLNSPITEEQWDTITDVDFDHTDNIWFHTKNGKDVEFVKRKTGKWEYKMVNEGVIGFRCSACGDEVLLPTPFCRNCGAEMRGETDA